MPQEPFQERPLIQCHIVLVSIEELHGHEQIVQAQVDWLKNNLKNLGYFFRPILIVKNHNVILDGHHRVVALQQLGYSKVPCIEMNYLDNEDIQLGTWYPVYTEKGKYDFPAVFKRIGVEWKRLETFSVDVLDNPDYGFILKTSTDQFMLKGTQQEIYAKFLDFYNPELFEYVKTLDYALHLIDNGHAVFILARKILKKQDVLESAKKGRPFAPKTTRHILSFKYQDIKVPLDNLV